MILVEDHQIPVHGVDPLVPGLDAACGLVHPQEILEGAEADDGLLLIGPLILIVDGIRRVGGVPGDELPALEIHVGHQILPPGGLHGGLECQDQHPLHPHPLRQLIGGEGLAEAHFGVPEELGRPVAVSVVDGAEICDGLVHRVPLLLPHGEGLCAGLVILPPGADGHDGGLHVLQGAAEPLVPILPGVELQPAPALQNIVDVVVVEAGPIVLHGGPGAEDAVRHPPLRILLFHTGLHVPLRVAHLDVALV